MREKSLTGSVYRYTDMFLTPISVKQKNTRAAILSVCTCVATQTLSRLDVLHAYNCVRTAMAEKDTELIFLMHNKVMKPFNNDHIIPIW